MDGDGCRHAAADDTQDRTTRRYRNAHDHANPRSPAANKPALRDAVAALNAGRHEDYLALFEPDARLHGFQAGIDDVDALSASTPPPPTRSLTRP